MRRAEINLIPLVLWAILLAGFAMAFGGCTPVEPGPEMPAFADEPPENVYPSPEYIGELSEQSVASTWDALRMVAPLTKDWKSERSLAALQTYLKAQSIMPPDWDLADEAEPLRAGKIAVLVVRALDIEGGVMRTLFPYSERYAVLELRHRELIHDVTPGRYITGSELVGIIRRASEYQKVGEIR